jgi:phage terminase large subunit-like protein
MGRTGNVEPSFTNVVHTDKSLGNEAVELYASTGQTLMEWQAIQVSGILERNDDDLWTYSLYGLAISRRNGKGEVLAAREFEGLVNLHEKICHTAHRATTSHDAFTRLYDLLKKSGYEEISHKGKKEVSEKSFYSSKKYGLEYIEVKDGGMIDFRTRTNNGGLGEGFDLLVIDEAQEYTSKQESALIYTVTASSNPQIILTGTPPTATSGGDVFVRTRNAIMAGKLEDTGWAEWSIDQQTADITNVDLWYQFNPSLGIRLTERNIRRELSVGEVDFNIQRLGLWLKYAQKSDISRAEWDLLKCDDVPPLEDQYYIGVKYGKDGVNVAASIAAKTKTGKIFVETLDCRSVRQGNAWILEYLHNPKVAGVAIDGANGQQILAAAMEQYGFQKPTLPKVNEVITACALFEQAVTMQTITHAGQPSLAESVSHCEKRAIGSNGGFGYKSITDEYDISIMESVIFAHWLAATAKEPIAEQTIDY